jgi:hypothetical protein
MANRTKWLNQHIHMTDGLETVTTGLPIVFEDDFLGSKLEKIIANENTVARWTDIIDDTMTSDWLLVANAPNGIACASLAATDEAERGVLYLGDQLPFNINQGLIMEFRMAYSVLTTAAGGIIVAGLASADNATADTVATNLWFRLESSSANILWESDDNATNDDDNDTGVDAVAETYHVFRIDCTTATAPKFYIDGVLVGTCAMAAVTASTARVQPYFAVEKASGASLGAVWLDYVRIWQNRSA